MTPNVRSMQSLYRFLTALAAAVCLVVCARLWQELSGRQPMWPFPGMYLLEMVLMSLIGLFGVFKGDSNRSAHVTGLTWVAAGVISTFVVMGAWSVGFLFLPAALLLVIAAILADRRRPRYLVVHLGIGVIAAVSQVALMLAAISLLYPDAVF